MQDYPSRRWPRLDSYDYSTEGCYFLTICTKGKKCILSRIVSNGDTSAIELTPYGRIAEAYLKSLPGIEKYVVMPNHVHCIVHKENGKSIAGDVRSFKGLVTKKIGQPIWQDYYYDHVIRNQDDYAAIWSYIDANPARWNEDKYNAPEPGHDRREASPDASAAAGGISIPSRSETKYKTE